jgi:hypothetical protein
MDKYLLIAGCGIFVLLGGAHLVYTFFSNKFDARDASLTEAMKQVSPVITRQTSMWKAWIGFNASHSMGAILFGLVFIVIALENNDYLRHSLALNAILLAVPLSYLILAIRFWFDKPKYGIILALTLILLSMLTRPVI